MRSEISVEVIMDSVEALFAFQLVELLTMISAEVPGVFEPHGTARRLQAYLRQRWAATALGTRAGVL